MRVSLSFDIFASDRVAARPSKHWPDKAERAERAINALNGVGATTGAACGRQGRRQRRGGSQDHDAGG
jgi:hypothetical protein